MQLFHVFILLCLAPKLFTTYCIFISKYHVALHQIWFIYYAYIGEVTENMIFRHYDGSFGLSSNQFICFFRGVWFSFNGSTCCPHLLEMLYFNHSYIYHLFPIEWSPYSSQCNGTYWDKHFSLPFGTTRYSNFTTLGCPFWGPLFQKSFKTCGTIMSSSISFFDELPTPTWICHTSNTCSFKHHVNTFPILCKFSHKCLIINPFYHTCISFAFGSLSYNITYPL
jgi:hypothetical protein